MPPEKDEPPPDEWTPAQSQVVCDVSRGSVAGTIAGIVVLGIGARIIMRISALLSPDAAGTITENRNVVGEITAGGTFALLIFVGLAGGLALGAVWVLIRDWLPASTWLRVPLAGLVAALLGSFTVVSAANDDFHVLEAPSANVAMFVAMVTLAGVTTAALDRVLEGRLPQEPIGYGLLMILGAAGALPLLVFFFFIGDHTLPTPPRIAGGFLVLASLATILNWVRQASGSEALARHQRWIRAVGVTGLFCACCFGALDLAQEIDGIL